MENAQNVLIAPHGGVPIHSIEHREFNSLIMDFLNSFLDFDAVVQLDGTVKDARMIKRLVSKITTQDNYVVHSSKFTKPLNSDTLTLQGGESIMPGTIVTISFKQQPV